jgi:hypothetical protein
VRAIIRKSLNFNVDTTSWFAGFFSLHKRWVKSLLRLFHASSVPVLFLIPKDFASPCSKNILRFWWRSTYRGHVSRGGEWRIYNSWRLLLLTTVVSTSTKGLMLLLTMNVVWIKVVHVRYRVLLLLLRVGCWVRTDQILCTRIYSTIRYVIFHRTRELLSLHKDLLRV